MALFEPRLRLWIRLQAPFSRLKRFSIQPWGHASLSRVQSRSPGFGKGGPMLFCIISICSSISVGYYKLCTNFCHREICTSEILSPLMKNLITWVGGGWFKRGRYQNKFIHRSSLWVCRHIPPWYRGQNLPETNYSWHSSTTNCCKKHSSIPAYRSSLPLTLVFFFLQWAQWPARDALPIK